MWLKNFAIIEIMSPLLTQTTNVLNPECSISGTFSNPKKLLQGSYQLNKEDTQTLTYLGRVLWLQGNCDEAITQWQQTYALTNNLGAGFELFRVGEYALLTTNTRLLIADRAYANATSLVGEGQEQTAYKWYQRAFFLVPKKSSEDALINLTSLSDDKLWQQIIEQLPETEAAYWWATARLNEQHQDWEQAALAYTHGVKLTADPYEFWMQIAFSWEKAANPEKAILAYKSAIQEQPENQMPYIQLGNVYRTQHHYQEALDWYTKAMTEAPGFSDPFYFSGITYYVMKDYTQARFYLEEAIKISPNHVSARVALAEVWHSENNPELAEKWILEAINTAVVAPAGLWIQLGDWRREWQNCLGARDAYTQAQSADADNVVVQQKLTTLMETCEP